MTKDTPAITKEQRAELDMQIFAPATRIVEITAEAFAGRIAELEAERGRLREALTEIAAFYDTGASEVLKRTGNYSSFDEPGAVRCARAALGGDNE